MPLVSEVVGLLGVFEILRALSEAPGKGMTEGAVYALAASAQRGESRTVVDELVSASLLRKDGHHFRLTSLGIRTYLLLEALNGGDISHLFSRLGRMDGVPPMYELVRQGMTESFLEGLVTRPGFGRLYICSPWINLTRRAKGCLAHAVLQIEKRHRMRPEILAITRPSPGDKSEAPETVKPLKDLGATVFLHPRLHSKLYIREPGSCGGILQAVVGSQNLTCSMNLELGIRINADSHIINQLIQYFWEVSSYCAEA